MDDGIGLLQIDAVLGAVICNEDAALGSPAIHVHCARRSTSAMGVLGDPDSRVRCQNVGDQAGQTACTAEHHSAFVLCEHLKVVTQVGLCGLVFVEFAQKVLVVRQYSGRSKHLTLVLTQTGAPSSRVVAVDAPPESVLQIPG